MTLLDLLKDLTYGELAQLKIGNMIPGEFESSPDPTRYEQLLTHINLGLTEIYKRFFLSSKEIYIQQYDQISNYVLSSKYAQSNVGSVEPIKYIVDTILIPFQDDVLKIEEVYDEAGNRYFLNDVSESLSIYTPNYRTLQVPYPSSANTMAVQYRANHPKIIYSRALNPALVEIELPHSLHESLLYYVAHRAFASLNIDQGTEGNSYLQKFLASVAEVDRQGLEVQAEPGIWRFDQSGWV